MGMCMRLRGVEIFINKREAREIFFPLGKHGEAGTMTTDASGNVYAAVYNGGIYKQTGGTGDFLPLGQTGDTGIGMTTDSNGNVYAAVSGGDIYKQTGGTGNFLPLGQTARGWAGMTTDSSGNVYATVWGGDIYKQTGGTGDFLPLGQTSRGWIGMTADSSGNIYAAVQNGDIYEKAVGGTPNLNGGELVLSSGVGKGIGDSKISFKTGTTLSSGNASQPLQTKMTILGNGNVGIGTVSPTEKLDVNGNINFTGELNINSSPGTSGQVLTSGGDGSSPTWVDANTVGVTDHGALTGLSDDDHTQYALLAGRSGDTLSIDQVNAFDATGLKLYDNGGNGIFVKDGGNVGIGTVSPEAILHIKTNTGTNSEIDIQSGSANKWGIYQDESTADLRFWNTDNRLSITDSGNVGIGTVSPSGTFDVEGGTFFFQHQILPQQMKTLPTVSLAFGLMKRMMNLLSKEKRVMEPL